MMNSRNVKQESLLTSLTIAVGITGGAILLWIAMNDMLATTFVTFFRRDYEFRNMHYSGSEDGENFFMSRTGRTGNLPINERFDLNGNRLPDERSVSGADVPPVPGRHVTIQIQGSSGAAGMVPASRIARIVEDQSGHMSWYAVREPGSDDRCWLECYDLTDGRRVFCIGTNGKQSDVPSVDHRFQIPPNRFFHKWGWSDFANNGEVYRHDEYSPDPFLFIADRERMYRVDVVTAEVVSLFESPGEIVSLTNAKVTDHATGATSSSELAPEKNLIVIRTPEKLFCYAANGQLLYSMSLQHVEPAALVQLYDFTAEGKSPRRYLEATTSEQLADMANVACRIWVLNDDYAFESDQPLHDLRWTNHGAGMSLNERCLAVGLAIPAPVLLAGAAVIQPNGVIAAPYQTSPAAVGIAAILTVLALFLFQRHSSRNQIPQRGVWLAFVLLFGIFGYLGYRCCRKWALREIASPSHARVDANVMLLAHLSSKLVVPASLGTSESLK